MRDQLSKRVRRIMHIGTYTPRVRPADEAPPRDYVPPKWDKSHPDMQWQVVRPQQHVKSRGDI